MQTLTVTFSIDGNPVWRHTREVKDKARYRMGLDEYDKVVKAAENELYTQAMVMRRKETKHERSEKDEV